MLQMGCTLRAVHNGVVDRPLNSNFLLYPSQLTKELFIARYRKGFRRSKEGNNAHGLKVRSQNIYALSRKR